MGSLTDFGENLILDAFLGDDHSSVFPDPVYIGLSTTTIADDGTGKTEPSVGGYERVSVANTTAEWPVAASGFKHNANTITFPVPTADWGTVVAYFIADALTAGHILFAGNIETSREVLNGDGAPIFSPGGLVIGSD